MEIKIDTESEKRGYVNCVVDYAELVMQLDNAVLAGCSEEKALKLVRGGLAKKKLLQEYDPRDSLQIRERLEGMIPRFFQRKSLVEEYKVLAKNPNAIRKKFEEEINSRNSGQPPIELSKPKASLFVPDIPYALGIIVGQQEMEKISTKLGIVEGFRGLHLGKGLVIAMVSDNEIQNGKFTPQTLRRVSDTLSHENFHALAEVMGAGADKHRLVETENRLYTIPNEEGKKITAREVDELISIILRMAKAELIPEANIDITVYKPDGETKKQFKTAFAFIISQVLNPIKNNIANLNKALKEPPSWWELKGEERLRLETQVNNLQNFIVDKIGIFLVAGGKAISRNNRRLLFYASTFLNFYDFDLLPAIAEVINLRHPDEEPHWECL